MEPQTILWIKKGIATLAAPFTLTFLLFAAGTVCVWTKRRQNAGRILVTLGCLVFLAAGYGLGSGLLQRLDSRHLPLDANLLAPELRARIRYVVVLGSGHVSDPRLPPTSVINADSLYRLVEGIRLQRQLPGSRLVLSGGPGFDTEANAQVMAEVAQSLGFPARDLLTEPRPTDTAMEARLLQPLLGKEPFVLVSSAAHMERAVDLFRRRGTEPLAAPTDYIFRKNKAAAAPDDLLPSLHKMGRTTRVVYELLGWLWGRITGGA